MKLISKLFAVSLAAVLSVSAAVMPVFAAPDVNMDYEGEIDPYTGEPVKQDSEEDKQYVSFLSGVLFDRKKHDYIYSVPGSAETISCSIASGMAVTDRVYLSVPKDIQATLYLDGEAMGTEDEEFDLTSVTLKENGAYSLVLSGTDSKSQFISFSIISEKTGRMNAFQVPEGFSLGTVMLNDEKQNYSVGANTVDMSKEGYYVIAYRCESIGMNYSLAVTVDHTPPAVTFEGLDDNNTAKNPVSIVGVEDTDTVKVLKDDQEIRISKDNIIRSPGKYSVTVTDDAGNSVTNEFEIQFYLNEQGWFFGIIFFLIIAAVLIYMYVSRKKLRVR